MCSIASIIFYGLQKSLTSGSPTVPSDSRAFHSFVSGPTVFQDVSDCLFGRPTVFAFPNNWLRSSPRLPRAPIAQFAKPVAYCDVPEPDRCLRLLIETCGWLWRQWLYPCEHKQQVVEIVLVHELHST